MHQTQKGIWKFQECLFLQLYYEQCGCPTRNGLGTFHEVRKVSGCVFYLSCDCSSVRLFASHRMRDVDRGCVNVYSGNDYPLLPPHPCPGVPRGYDIAFPRLDPEPHRHLRALVMPTESPVRRRSFPCSPSGISRSGPGASTPIDAPRSRAHYGWCSRRPQPRPFR